MKKTRCWKGYEPVAGKKAYSEGSCKKSSQQSKKVKTQSWQKNPQLGNAKKVRTKKGG
jgi:hypothetical protein